MSSAGSGWKGDFIRDLCLRGMESPTGSEEADALSRVRPLPPRGAGWVGGEAVLASPVRGVCGDASLASCSGLAGCGYVVAPCVMRAGGEHL